MADKIRGITIEIGGDTSGLTKSLKGVNSEINSTSKQLKDVERLLKLDPTNTELLKQKQQLLAQQVTQTKDKVRELKELQDKMDQNGIDKNSEQYMALQREIIATEGNLKSLEKAAGDSNVALEKIGATADKVSAGAQKVADKTKALSGAAAGLIGSLAGAAYGSITASDDLNTLAKQTGFSTEELQKMQYASDVVDVSVEDITGSLKKLRKNMDSTSADTEEAFSKIGVSVRDNNGELRDSTEVFYEVLEGLSKIDNETERDTLAMTLFGKSADNLAGIVDDGGKALKEMGDQAEDLGLILDQDTLDALNETNDKIDILKANAAGTVAQLGASAAEVFLPMLENVIEKAQVVLDWLGQLDSGTLNMIVTILAVIAAISPLAGMISGIGAAISFVASNPIVLLIAAIAGLVALIIANWDKIKEVLDRIWEKVSDIFDKIKQKARDMINGVIDVLNRGINAINQLIGGFNSISFTMPRWLGGGSWSPSVPYINNIPYLANGGILSSGSAVVGEAGPELLTMAGNKAVVQPLTASLDSKSLSAIGVGGQTTVNIEFTGSLAQLARVLQPEIVAETNRRGPSLINA